MSIMTPGAIRRFQEGGDATATSAPDPYVASVQRADRSMDPVMQQLLFGLDGSGGFIPGAMRAAERSFFDDQGRPIVVPQEIAGFSPDQVMAMNMARGAVGMQTPYLQRADQAYQTGLGALQRGLGAQLGSQRMGLDYLMQGARREDELRESGLQDALGGIQDARGLFRGAERGLRRDLGEQRGFQEDATGRFQRGMRGATGRFGREVDEFGREIRGATRGLGRAASRMDRDLGRAQRMLGRSTGRFDQDMTQEFFDPYEDQVVQQTIDDAMKAGAQQDISAVARDLASAGQSAFGSRARLGAEERLEALGRGLAKDIGGIRSAGFQRAQQAALGEFARQKDAQRAAASGLSGLAGQRFGARRDLAGQRMGAAGAAFGAEKDRLGQRMSELGSAFGADQALAGLMGDQAQQRFSARSGLGQQMLGLGQAGQAAKTAAGQGALGTAGALQSGFGDLGAVQGAAGSQMFGAGSGYGGFLSNLGQQAQGASMADINMMMGMGGAQQALRQQELDAQRAALLQAQLAPLAQYQSMMPFISLAGAQTGPSTTQTLFTPPPSPLQAGLGVGLSGLGALGTFVNPPRR